MTTHLSLVHRLFRPSDIILRFFFPGNNRVVCAIGYYRVFNAIDGRVFFSIKYEIKLHYVIGCMNIEVKFGD